MVSFVLDRIGIVFQFQLAFPYSLDLQKSILEP